MVGVLIIIPPVIAAGEAEGPPTSASAPATRPATAPATQAVVPEEAKRLFRRMEELGREFDPALADLYDDAAVIRNTRRYPNGQSRTMTIAAPRYKQMIRTLMPAAKARGDLSTYSDVTFTLAGDRIRIDAMRYSHLKEYSSPISWLVGPSEGGAWLVFQEISESRP
jgi:hypothetical protein